MTYHKISIKSLSHNQLLKLLRGHRIRVKHGSGHEVHVSEEQHKKIMNSHHKGMGCTLQFDPYQIDMHKNGHGFFDAFKSIGKVVAPALIDSGANLLKGAIAGSGIRGRPRKVGHHSHHEHHAHHGHHAHGDGFFDAFKSIGKVVAPTLIDEGANLLKGAISGSGARRGRPRKAGHGEGVHHHKSKKSGALNPAGYGEGKARKRRGKGFN